MKLKLFPILILFSFPIMSKAQWILHPPSSFGGDTVYQPIFSLINSNLIYCVAGRNAWSEGKPRKNALYKTSDGAKSWTRILDGENTGMGLITFGLDTVFVSLGGHLMRSFDGMKTHDTLVNEAGLLTAFSDRTIYYSIPQKGTFRSTNLGNTFNKISDNIWWTWVNSQVAYSIEFPQFDVIKTTDGGKTWIKCSKINASFQASNWTFEFVSENIIFAMVDSKMFKSINGGKSWFEIKNLGGKVNNSSDGLYFINEKDVYYSFRGQFYKTNDSGKTWCLQPPSMNGSDFISQLTNVMHFENDSLGIWANSGGATGMTTMTTTNQGGPPCPSDTTIKGLGAEPGFNQLKVYPNPSSGLLTLTLEQGQMSLVQLFTVDGRLVFSQKLAEQEATLRLPSISPGIYILEVQTTENQVLRQKLVME